MMSLTQFRIKIFEIFKFMESHQATIEIYHRRKVYRIHIEETGEKIKLSYNLKYGSEPIPIVLLEQKECPHCESILIAGICMNTSCPGQTD